MADVELLPLYAELQGHPKLEIIKHYARANVAHVTAAKDAEIKALRAEVERQKEWLAWWGRFASEQCTRAEQAEARAERLLGALRWIASDDTAKGCDDGMQEVEAIKQRAHAELNQEPKT